MDIDVNGAITNGFQEKKLPLTLLSVQNVNRRIGTYLEKIKGDNYMAHSKNPKNSEVDAYSYIKNELEKNNDE